MNQNIAMLEKLKGMLKRPLLVGFVASLFIPAMADDITISQDDVDMGMVSTMETFLINSGDTVTLLSGTDFVVDIPDVQRWQFRNYGTFNIESGAYFKVSNTSYTGSNNTAYNVAGNMNISGEAVFLRYASSNTTAGLFLAFDGYGNGPAGTVTVEAEGILRTYYTTEAGSTNETGTCRVHVGWLDSGVTSSKLVLKTGSTICSQGIELYKGASLRIEKGVSMYDNLAQTAETFIIVNRGSSSSESVKIELGDGFEYSRQFLIKGSSYTNIIFDKQKSEGVFLGGILSYDSLDTNSASINFINFTNNYLLLGTNNGITISGDDGSIIKLAAFNSYWKTMDMVFTAYGDDNMTEGFSSGWYFQEAYGDDGEVIGAYLNNSNFPIPEPAHFAFIFGVLALIGVFANRRI